MVIPSQAKFLIYSLSTVVIILLTHNCIKNLEGVETNERDPLTGRFLPKRSSSSVGLK